MEAVLVALRKAIAQLSDPKVVRVAVKSVLVTLVILIAFGGFLFAGLTWLFAWMGFDDGGYASAAAALILSVLAAWLLFRVIAVAVLQFFADEIVAAVEEAHYPEAARCAVPLPFAKDVGNSVRGIGRALGINLLALPFALILLITGIGAAVVFLLANAWLLGRELTDMTWFRHCEGNLKGNPVSQKERFLLGGAVALIMMVPIVGFIAPIIGAAAGAHLTHRTIAAGKGAGVERV